MARYALMVAALLGFLATAAVENIMLPMLRQWQMRRMTAQPILRRNQPETPTMGGFAVVFGTIAAVTVTWLCLSVMESRLMDGYQRQILVTSVLTGFAFALVGIWDDMRGYLRKDHRPLPWLWRFALEAFLALGFLGVLHLIGALPTGTVVPFVGYVDFGGWYIPLTGLALVALVETAHMSAGEVGVCSMNGFFACLVCSAVAALQNHLQMSLYATALGGALLAYLLWGFPPAKLLLGRSGSTFIAASIGVISISMGWGGLLLLLGGVYWLEGIAYVLQGLSYRLRKRPLFKILPIQAAMDAAGWEQVRIIGTMGLAAFTFAVLALLQVLSATS